MTTTMGEIVQEVRRFSDLLDKGVDALRDNARTLAGAEHAYRLAVAQAWMKAPEGTAGARDAWVKGETADMRRMRDVSEGMRVAALEAVRSRRQQLSAVQSLLAAHRSEADALRFGPEMTP